MDATFRDNLKRVRKSSIVGNMAKSRGFSVYMVVMRTMTERVILSASRKSRIRVGTGNIIARRIAITAATIPMSEDSFMIAFKMPVFSAAIFSPFMSYY